MNGKTKVYHLQCSITKQDYLIETSENEIVNFVECPISENIPFPSAPRLSDLSVSSALRSCQWCGSRTASNCDCQKNKMGCPERGTYRYQCLFCKNMTSPRALGDIHSLRLSVTSPRYDDIGSILSEMGLSYSSFNSIHYDCDVLFINCGTSDAIEPEKLQSFVQNGGCVYISDLACRYIDAAFPGIASFECKGETGEYDAAVDDPGLREIIGDRIRVNFDLVSWAIIKRHSGTTMISGKGSKYRKPMMFSVNYGAGQIFYTSFHNHSQATKRERSVLQVMLMRQIGTVCNATISEVTEMLGLNISDIRASIQND